MPSRVLVEIGANSFRLIARGSVVRGIDDLHLLHADHRRLVFDGRRDEVIDRQLVGVGDAVPLIALEKAKRFFRVGIQIQPAVMVDALPVFPPDMRFRKFVIQSVRVSPLSDTHSSASVP